MKFLTDLLICIFIPKIILTKFEHGENIYSFFGCWNIKMLLWKDKFKASCKLETACSRDRILHVHSLEPNCWIIVLQFILLLPCILIALFSYFLFSKTQLSAKIQLLSNGKYLYNWIIICASTVSREMQRRPATGKSAMGLGMHIMGLGAR